MLRKGRLGVHAEVEGSSSGAAAKGPAALVLLLRSSAEDIVSFALFFVGEVWWCIILEYCFEYLCDDMRRVVVLYIVCGRVVGWGREVDGVRGGDFLVDFRNFGWGRSMISRYVMAFYRVYSAKFKFQVGLVVGVR